MNTHCVLMVTALLGLPLLAHASCDQVKSSIDAKIQANGVSHYTLEVVPDDQADNTSGKVVGTCEGSQKIIYTRGASDSDASNHAMTNKSMSDAPAPSSSS